jgi:hypothetical protein
MKHFFTIIVVGLAVAFTAVSAHADPVSKTSHFAKRYGGFKPGDQFTLRVTDKDVIKTFGDVPNEVPSFREDAKIRFTIGKRGQLTAREGVYIPLEDGSGDGNRYERIGSNPTKLTSIAYIDKNGNGKAAKGKLTFTITSFDNIFPMRYQVIYTLKK